MFRFLSRIVHPEAEVTVSASDAARFVDSCVKQDIPLREVYPDEVGGALTLTMRARDYKKMKPVARKLGAKTKITAKKGVPFFFDRIKGRYVLMAGAALLVGTVLLTNFFIWDIDVVGNESISEREIMANLRDIGVKIGAPSFGHDADELQNELRLRLPKTSWLAVNIRGSKVTVLLRERTPVPLLIPSDEPCDVVAMKPGVLTDVRVYKGEQLVFPGQTVVAGQTLAGGHMLLANGVERYVRASADVFARTWVIKTCVAPKKSVMTRETGRTRERTALIFGETRFNLYFNSGNPFGFCGKMIERKDLSVLGVSLNVTILREKFAEYEIYEADTADILPDAYINEWLTAYLKTKADGEMISARVYAEETEVLTCFRQECEFLENIAAQRKIDMGRVNLS